MEFRPSKEHDNADALSRLLLESVGVNTDKTIKSTLMLSGTTFSVMAADIVKATQDDSVLAKVHESVLVGKPLPDGPEFTPYANIKEQLNSEEGVLLMGNRVIIPATLTDKILQTLHEEHMGITKMKALARCYVWWPNMNRDTESMVTACMLCQQHRNNPPEHTSHPWDYSKGPWQRIHTDFAGPITVKLSW